jgi:hypothetical protein
MIVLGVCNSIYFQRNFKNWTSGDDDIDKFIQDTQLSAQDDIKKAIEWIPYDRFYNITYIAEEEFGKVYRANWIDGSINCWDKKNRHWKRENQNTIVKFISLNNSENIALEFTNKV